MKMKMLCAFPTVLVEHAMLLESFTHAVMGTDVSRTVFT